MEGRGKFEHNLRNEQLQQSARCRSYIFSTVYSDDKRHLSPRNRQNRASQVRRLNHLMLTTT